MDEEVKVGKFTLESLTTGMYEQPLIIYREYIQNAVDSLEEAVHQKLLSTVSMRVDVTLNHEERSITITDNGAGIPCDLATQTLLSVGASLKKQGQTRGFRGIGRLGGLSYCERLVFRAKAYRDERGTKVTFDCKKLKQLFLPGESDNLTMSDVISMVSTVEYFQADVNEHYFQVKLEGVDDTIALLDGVEVEDYLSQTSPVAFHPHFSLSTKINQHLFDHDIAVEEFPVFLDTGNGHAKPLYKSFKRHYTAGRSETTVDIYDVELFEVLDSDNQMIALGWYAKSDWPGTIHDDSIRGLRLRKGNIQIGDERTLDEIFKQTRFNGWTQGEVYVLSNELIPNARRDNFEQNQAYHQLIDALRQGVGAEISSLITEASRLRNDPAKKAIDSGKKLAEQTEYAIGTGFNSRIEKEKTKESVEKTINKLSTIRTSKPAVEQAKEAAIKDLEQVLLQVEEQGTYKYDKIKGAFSRKQRHIIQVVTDVLTEYLDNKLLEQIVDDIIKRLQAKSE